MARRRRILGLMVALIVWAAPALGSAAETISFTARDRVQVFADYYPAQSAAQPLILLFHQAGSNRGEYATIAPMLVALGFNALAIDQRSGGSAGGRVNETLQHLGRSTGFGEALADLEAAVSLAETSRHRRQLVGLGRHQSAALVFLL